MAGCWEQGMADIDVFLQVVWSGADGDILLKILFSVLLLCNVDLACGQVLLLKLCYISCV